MVLNAQEIQKIIPHRWPFLLVDKILELEPGKSAVGLKQVSAGEIYFQGHFPGQPIMPGVLIVEALAQVGSVALLSSPEHRGKIGLFAGIDRFRFRRPVVPGDTLRLEVTLTKLRGAVGKGTGRAEVDGQVVAEGELLFAIASPQNLGT
ncbi:MAG: 3-hydroxyacyl-ACP dehydratase FabZ [Dehalococcoidia bacterium]|nr:3-hydroxyacyl-ACP dehydratase FabZ [Dehalococcoidia bacterium]